MRVHIIQTSERPQRSVANTLQQTTHCRMVDAAISEFSGSPLPFSENDQPEHQEDLER